MRHAFNVTDVDNSTDGEDGDNSTTGGQYYNNSGSQYTSKIILFNNASVNQTVYGKIVINSTNGQAVPYGDSIIDIIYPLGFTNTTNDTDDEDEDYMSPTAISGYEYGGIIYFNFTIDPVQLNASNYVYI